MLLSQTSRSWSMGIWVSIETTHWTRFKACYRVVNYAGHMSPFRAVFLHQVLRFVLRNPETHPTVQQILQHEFFHGITTRELVGYNPPRVGQVQPTRHGTFGHNQGATGPTCPGYFGYNPPRVFRVQPTQGTLGTTHPGCLGYNPPRVLWVQHTQGALGTTCPRYERYNP